MPQQFLNGTIFTDTMYTNSLQPTINAYSNPMCPGTFAGETHVYDMATHTCKALPKTAFSAEKLAQHSGKCGADMPHGGPFMMEIDGKCYHTNNCPASSNLTQQCLNTQQVAARPNPLSGPGVICGGCHGDSRACGRGCEAGRGSE
jgi:hypothetical protein